MQGRSNGGRNLAFPSLSSSCVHFRQRRNLIASLVTTMSTVSFVFLSVITFFGESRAVHQHSAIYQWPVLSADAGFAEKRSRKCCPRHKVAKGVSFSLFFLFCVYPNAAASGKYSTRISMYVIFISNGRFPRITHIPIEAKKNRMVCKEMELR